MTAFTPSRIVQANLFGSLFGRVGQETSPITPNSDFYITSYDITPTIDLTHWSLTVRGMVKQPLTLTYEEIGKIPQTTMISTLECIGNPAGGYSIGTAEWEGIRLNRLLDEAGVNPKAVDLVLHGADEYSDSIPLARAMDEEVLLATKMNGVPLPADHGFPARLIVPGIYGMKNVKWLTALELVNYDYKGYWQRQSWPDDAHVKLSSRIDLPGDRQTIQTKHYTIKGIAFGGRHQIQKVELSTDAGKSWKHATILPRLSPYAWVLWTYAWEILQTGEYTLMARATDERGAIQKLKPSRTPSDPMDIHAITVEAQI